ncbi:MAG: serine/threonine protein kinase [Polyangiaceae bacterium]|nr:serine/threonine protein kinase [Polyangiaceae bacterium]
MVERAEPGFIDDPPVNMPKFEELPKQFGKYTLLRKLAAGGMAEIFLALHRSMAGFEKLVVIKRILPSMNQDKAFIDMLLHEARIAATLSHPNIVQIFDVGQVDGTFFIAMEHIHGEDIRAIVRGMRRKNVVEFPLEHALAITLGVCAGLAYAHDRRDLEGKLLGIVHRDISPQNIVVTFTGDVKIVDFGIAKSEKVKEDLSDGQLKGKVPYMSPEQAAGKELDLRSDIFAVGVVLFELTTGRRLFKGPNELETLKLILESDYPLPSEVRPGYPKALENIVMKALARRREDRYQTAREMQADIEAFVREERIGVSAVSLTHWMQMLFAEKLAQQNEALQDIKQLADVIAAQQKEWDPTATVSGTLSAPLITHTIVEPPRRSNAPLIAGVAVAVAIGIGAFFVVKGGATPPSGELVAPAGSASTEAPRGFVEVITDPPGCAIWVNGDLRPEVSPAKVEQLPFGREIQLKLTSEGLEAYRENFTLSADAPSKKVDVKMRAGSVTVVLKVDPPPTIWVDGKPYKGDRTKIENLSAGEEHKIVLSATGLCPKRSRFLPSAVKPKQSKSAL